jgi:hypothetical protein
MKKTIFTGLSITLEEGDGIYEAKASLNGEHLITDFCTREDGALAGLFANLKKLAIQELKMGPRP